MAITSLDQQTEQLRQAYQSALAQQTRIRNAAADKVAAAFHAYSASRDQQARAFDATRERWEQELGLAHDEPVAPYGVVYFASQP